ncbi:MAG TPA: zinc ABC transporter ATP-binding protein ZnuC [Gammaproteobacteria bacterium]|nr:zinc ABC transporter ATP-binding protein ZnuC [Gammaproteobacteria bacterium]
MREVQLTLGGRRVLEQVDLAVRGNEIVTLVGPNGAGKSTLVRVLLGLIKPDEGSVWLQPGLRVGYMPQRLSVDPVLPLTVSRFLTLGRRCSESQVRQVLQEVGAAELLPAQVQSVSGGELQRILLARALLRDPQLLILDEPVQGVDVAGQADLYRLIGHIRERLHCGILMVSHDLHLVMATTDRVVCLNRHICCSGSPEDVRGDPAYLALFGSAPELAVYTHHHDHRHQLDGHVVAVDGGGKGGDPRG